MNLWFAALARKMLFSRLGATLARAVVWGLRHDFERGLPACKSLRQVGRCTRLRRRYQFKPWTARRVNSDFRGLVKRGGIGIGFGGRCQRLDRGPAAFVAPKAEQDGGALWQDAPQPPHRLVEAARRRESTFGR